MSSWGSLLLVVSAVTASAAEIDSAALLSRVQSKVRENARSMPRYICRQTIVRQAFTRLAPQLTVAFDKHAGCDTLPEAGLPKIPSSTLAVTDRAHLDVLLSEGKELFAWPGGRSFDTADPDELLAVGLSGSGDFASFVIDVFNLGKVTFEYLGACRGAACARYRYDVPVETSRYVVKSPENVWRKLGFHGTFDVDPQSSNLVRISVIATDPSKALPEACDIRTRMTYTRTAVEAREFMMPESTEREYLSKDGSYSMNHVVYEGCHEYTAESVLTFGDDAGKPPPGGPPKAPPALPVTGSELQLRFVSKIDSEVASAGDGLEATLVRPLGDKDGGRIPAGTSFRGHLTQLERAYIPRRQLLVGIRFDAIVLNGAPVPLLLNPTGEADPHGDAIFSFPGVKRVVLDKRFVSRWLVGPPVAGK